MRLSLFSTIAVRAMSLLHGTAALFLAQVDNIIEVGW